ncbi:hypothetical protein AGOR_G00195820 [Albula goreensis]|uniref:non-specific serine/threonine protein kinase n=1 Tax=Albula goreensis TaxID=1534307 RepID=A0A8T3CT56_9TELE|nr:hypothetical protein AGOR_G00195820 [Albula goreensis]
MSAVSFLLVMSSSFFNPSFAFSSHFDSDGAPLSELSWSSSLAVVAVSFSGLFTFIFLMLACLCCKKGDIGFKEFENTEGEEFHTDLSALASPSSQNGPDVYILPLTEVSLPVSQQPGRSVQLLRSTDVGRRSLLYVKEMGHGWFGKVLLGEVVSGVGSMQVVVKELSSSASVQDQIHFLEEAKPYRTLQHPALLQCLAQCTEATPYLLIMELCPLGDLKSYLRSCRDSMTFDPLVLQRMACEISSGLLHLHKHNFIHSDLALRNCLLTSDITVKIGDYGLCHSKYKEDYLVTPDQLWIPLRWIGPELVDEVHGNLLVVDQTKPSNIWSLGVTIWELFELGSQPYRHYSDRQVLIYVVKEQQLKLSKPLLDLPLSDRWYEVMQFCWLQPEQRPNAEEVHLLLSYLCAKGASEAEDDFEKRWNSLRPNGSLAPAAAPGPLPPPPSPFPLLQHLPAPEPGDDILTVTETSHGLNFEYQWEQAQHDPSCSQAPHSGFQDVYYPPGPAGLSLGVSPSYYEPPKPLPVAGPVPSLGGDYYSRLDGRGLDCPVCPYSPEYQGSSSSASFLTGSGDSGECLGCPAPSLPHHHSYWPSHIRKASTYDWDGSPTFSLTMEPLLGEDPCGSSHTCSPAHTCSPTHSCSPAHGWETGHYVSYKHRDGGYYYEPPPEHYLVGGLAGISEPAQESWGSRSLRQALGELENPLGLSPSLSSPDQDYSAPYLQGKSTAVVGSGGYWDMLGPLRSTMPRPHSLSIAPEPGGALLHVQHPLYTPTPTGWASNCSANNNSLSSQQQPGGGSGARHFHYTLPSAHSRGPSLRYPESRTLGGHSHTLPTPASRDSGSCIYLHPQDTPPSPCLHKEEGCPFVDPLSGATVQIYTTSHHHHLREKSPPPLAREGAVLSGGLEKSGEEGPLHPGAPGEPISASGLGGDSGVGRGSSIISLVDINDCSDDDITDVTSGVFADSPLDCDSLGGSIPALEKQQEIPAATELSPSPTPMNPPSPTSMHPPSTTPSQPPSPTPSQPPSPPKALDSGYDTENNESPEFVLKEPQELAPPSGKQSPSGDPHEDANDPPSTEPGLTSLSQNTPYRDSAYFSDYDADSEGRGFSDKQDEENPEMATHTERLCPPQAVLGDSASSSPDSQSYQVYQHIGVESSSECSTPSTCSLQEALGTAGEESLHKSPAADPAPGSSTAMMDKAEREQKVVAEEGKLEVDEDGQEFKMKIEEEEIMEKVELEKKEEVECNIEVEMDTSLGELLEEVPASQGGRQGAQSSAPLSLLGGRVSPGDGEEGDSEDSEESDEELHSYSLQEEEQSEEVQNEQCEELHSCNLQEEEQSEELQKEQCEELHSCSLQEEKQSEELQKEQHEELHSYKLQEEQRGEHHKEQCEELHRFSMQDEQQSEEEEEEESSQAVPVVVCDSSHALHLRSLLKMPALLTNPPCNTEHACRRKAVSFFDDVTVYLFDQESPTRELAEHSFPVGPEPGGRGFSPGAQSSGQGSEGVTPPLQERVSDDSSDGNLSEESGGFEWEDDFHLLSSPSLMMSSTSDTLEALEAKPSPRFSISRFSITHVTDSDMDSAGGSSEDGERE